MLFAKIDSELHQGSMQFLQLWFRSPVDESGTIRERTGVLSIYQTG